MRPACLRRPTGGFTLLEAIVSVAVMGIGLVAVLEAYGAAMRLSLQDENLTTATFLARGKMEEILKERYLTAGTDRGDFGEEFEGFTWAAEIADSPVEGLETITVTVTWNVRSLSDELVLTSAAPRREPTEGETAAGGQPG